MMGVAPTTPDPRNAPEATADEELSASETAALLASDTVKIRSPQPGRRDPLDELITLSGSRNLLEAIDAVSGWAWKLRSKHQNPPKFSEGTSVCIDSAHPEQYGDLVYIPRIQGGTAYIFSDLEGHFSPVKTALRDHQLLERLTQNDPNDQVHIIVPGDAIDRRGGEGSRIIDFLMDLKWNRGFERNIHFLAGNHELRSQVQWDRRSGGFGNEVVHYRESFQTPIDLSSDSAQRVLQWQRDYFGDDLQHEQDVGHTLRVALWRLYNVLFQLCPKQLLTGNGFLICHAGLTDKGPFAWIADPDRFSKPSFQEATRWLANTDYGGTGLGDEERQRLMEMRAQSIADVTWSDFIPKQVGTGPNTVRNEGLFFGPDALERYLSALNAKVMIRGHQKNCPQGATIRSPNAWTAGSNIVTLNSVIPGTVTRYGDFDVTSPPSIEYLEVDLGSDADMTRIKIHTC